MVDFKNPLCLGLGFEPGALALNFTLTMCFFCLGGFVSGRLVRRIGTRLTLVAAGVTLFAVKIGSLPLCVIGLCLTGLSYGTSPTVSSAFTSAFYGQKHFATNLSISNFNLMFASFIATACSSLQVSSGGYTLPFVLLLALSAVAFALNISIKRP